MSSIHISIDDVNEDFFLGNNLYLYLKKLNKKYFAKFTVYIQNWKDFDVQCIKKKMDFRECESWLKFGIHTTSEGKEFIDCDSLREANYFIEKILEMGIAEDNIATVHRLHTFSGTKECILSMKQSMNGEFIKGLFVADDARKSYYLDSDICKKILTDSVMAYDNSNDIFFIPTDLRLDWFDRSFNSKYEYNKPVFKNPYKELERKYFLGEYDNRKLISVFTHSWQLCKNGHMTRKKRWLKDVCLFAAKYGFSFGYPEDYLVKEGTIEFYE